MPVYLIYNPQCPHPTEMSVASSWYGVTSLMQQCSIECEETGNQVTLYEGTEPTPGTVLPVVLCDGEPVLQVYTVKTEEEHLSELREALLQQRQ